LAQNQDYYINLLPLYIKLRYKYPVMTSTYWHYYNNYTGITRCPYKTGNDKRWTQWYRLCFRK